VTLVLVPHFLKAGAIQIASMTICISTKSEKSLKNFSLFYDVLISNLFFKYDPLRAQASCTALVSRETVGVNLRQVVRNFFRLKLVTLTRWGGEWSASRAGRALPQGKGPSNLILLNFVYQW
jgi:hypothetical protein